MAVTTAIVIASAVVEVDVAVASFAAQAFLVVKSLVFCAEDRFLV